VLFVGIDAALQHWSRQSTEVCHVWLQCRLLMATLQATDDEEGEKKQRDHQAACMHV